MATSIVIGHGTRVIVVTIKGAQVIFPTRRSDQIFLFLGWVIGELSHQSLRSQIHLAGSNFSCGAELILLGQNYIAGQSLSCQAEFILLGRNYFVGLNLFVERPSIATIEFIRGEGSNYCNN